MFRQINIKDSNESFKATLWRNRREALCEIDNTYIKTVKRSMLDVDYFELEIPKWIDRNGERIFNPLYLKIQPRQQIIVETTVGDEIKKERFIITEPSRKGNKDTGSKSFKAYSFEHTLRDKRTSFDGKVIQLKNDNIHLSEGIMDKFVRETGWSIKSVDPKARTETMSAMEVINVNMFNNFTSGTIANNGLIFEKSITTTISDNRPLYISFEYSKLKIYEGSNLLIENPTVSNTITDAIHKNIKKIQAYHYSDVGNRYGIRYVFTLTDDTTVERIAVFANIINKKFACENIKMTWETGNLIETDNVKYINIESLDMDWFSALRDLQDKFNSVFLFDSYNKSISVISRKTLEGDANLSPYVLSYDNAILDINVTETSEFVTGLKVMGKDGLSIVSENIYGDDIVRDYSEYIRRGIVSPELEIALGRYEKVLLTKQQEWLNIKNNLLDETQKQIRIQSEIKSLQDRIKVSRTLLAAFMKEGDSANQKRTKSEIDALETRFNQCSALYTQYHNNIQKFNDEMGLISQSTTKKNIVDSKGKIFAEEDLIELGELEVVKEHKDEYYSSSFALINSAKKILSDMIEPQVDFKINCPNLCKIIQNKNGWNYVMKLGNLFKVEGVDIFEELVDKQDYSVRLIGYDYEPKDNRISNLIFTNKIEKINNLKSWANLGKKSNTSMDTLNTYKKIFDDAKTSNNFVKEILDNGLDLSAHIAKGRGISNFIDISEAGIYLYDQSDMNKCVYIGSSLICISKDGFATSETAISSDGIFARLLVGAVILGEKLYITSENGEFYIGDMNDSKDGFGLRIKDGNATDRIFLGTEVDSDGIRRAKLRLMSKDGREVVLDENGIIQVNQMLCWDNLSPSYPMRIPYICDAGVSVNKKIMLSLIFEKYRAFERGMKSGGSVKSSSDGGGGTSGSGGGQTSSSGGGGTSGSGGGFNLEAFTGRGTFESDTATISMTKYPDDYYIDGNKHQHGHTMNTNQLPHRHSLIIQGDNHSHLVYSHTHQVYDHTHTVPSHTHTTDTAHTHDLEYGIFEQNSICTNVKIYVDDVLVRSGINSDSQVDITSYIKINSTNNIRIETATNGRLTCNIFTKAFVSF